MRLTKALITATALSVAVMGAVLAAVIASSGAFAFHDWPEAPAAVTQASALEIGTSPSRKVSADARPRSQRATGAGQDLLAQAPTRAPATVPSPAASPRPAPAPATRRVREPHDARAHGPAPAQPAPESDPAPAPTPVPVPAPPVPGGPDLPAKDIPGAPPAGVPAWNGPEQARKHTRPGRRDGTD